GSVQDAIIIHNDVDKSGIPIYSLYNERKEPTSEMLDDIDIFVADIQDIGSRFYTYANTMEKAMITCGKRGIPFVVLDRPNPLNGEIVEGPFVDMGFHSFVGNEKLPIRHGLTLGELALYFNYNKGKYCELHVIPLKGWKREMYFAETGLPFVSPSPNISSLHAVICYNATCFFEGTNVSEGRGTIKPFEWIGAPFFDGVKLSATLNDKHLKGVHFIPRTFTPMMFDHSGISCEGIEIVVTDSGIFRAFMTGLSILETIQKLYTDEFIFGTYAEIPDRPYIDYLFGSDRWRKKMISLPEALEKEKEDVEEFLELRKDILLYE
ncbi:MAG: DUF1343 domain-containing protein, partial [Cyclobacteriaceae bacterium]|nr:DUF1343 domain-containing protein [Cyclobacteriaceae bacterium]